LVGSGVFILVGSGVSSSTPNDFILVGSGVVFFVGRFVGSFVGSFVGCDVCCYIYIEESTTKRERVVLV
jgi:hypothetical protein